MDLLYVLQLQLLDVQQVPEYLTEIYWILLLQVKKHISVRNVENVLVVEITLLFIIKAFI